MNAEYLTPAEAARYLKTSTSTLAKMRVSGKGPHFTRLGSSIRYLQSWLDIWMAGSASSTSRPRQPRTTLTDMAGSDARAAGDETFQPIGAVAARVVAQLEEGLAESAEDVPNDPVSPLGVSGVGYSAPRAAHDDARN